MLMRFHQETEVPVFTEVRGQEYFGRLAVHLSGNKRGENPNISSYFKKSSIILNLNKCLQSFLFLESPEKQHQAEEFEVPS